MSIPIFGAKTNRSLTHSCSVQTSCATNVRHSGHKGTIFEMTGLNPFALSMAVLIGVGTMSASACEGMKTGSLSTHPVPAPVVTASEIAAPVLATPVIAKKPTVVLRKQNTLAPMATRKSAISLRPKTTLGKPRSFRKLRSLKKPRFLKTKTPVYGERCVTEIGSCQINPQPVGSPCQCGKTPGVTLQ